MYCSFCGKKIEDNSVFCTYCGMKTSALQDENINKKTIVEESITREPILTKKPQPISELNQNNDILLSTTQTNNNSVFARKNDISSKLFGFRSNKTWKKALASLFFVFEIFILFYSIIYTSDADFTNTDKFISKFEIFLVFLSGLLPYLFLCDFSKTKNKLIKKGKKFNIVIIVMILFFTPLFTISELSDFRSEESIKYEKQLEQQAIKSNESESTPLEEKVKTKNESTTISKRTNIINQLVDLGFSKKEAEKYTDIFKKVGVDEIYDIHPLLGTGIDDLQNFQGTMFGEKNLFFSFTVENRKLACIYIIIPSHENEAYISSTGKLKIKTTPSTKEVTLYDKWDDDGNYIEDKNGYIAILDYKNKTIKPYKK